MGKKRTFFAIVLIIALFFDNSQFSEAKALRSLPITTSLYYSMEPEDANVLKEDYDITYYLNGGIPSSDLTYNYIIEELPLTLDIPEKPGYNFAGWYTESSYQNKITEINIDNFGDVSLYAKWTKKIDSSYSVEMYPYSTASQMSGNDRMLKDCGFSFAYDVNIPGMPSTREQDYAQNMTSTDNQCPQGICITEDYYMITAYNTDDSESLGALYIFDKETGEYMVTLGMKKNSHLGGLTYDGRNVWICHSDTRSLERLSYSYIKKIAESRPKIFVDATGMFEEYRVANMPSCITWHDGILWVATHNTLFKSIMISYKYQDGELMEQQRYQIPEKVQGIAFDEQDRVYLSTSYGRSNSSYLKIYQNVDAMDTKPRAPELKVEMPPCSEEINYADGNIYVLFESASSKYFEGTDGKGKSICPIDRILTIDTNTIFP